MTVAAWLPDSPRAGPTRQASQLRKGRFGWTPGGPEPCWPSGLASLVGIGLFLTRRADRRSTLPFGPFMLGGAYLGLLAGAN